MGNEHVKVSVIGYFGLNYKGQTGRSDDRHLSNIDRSQGRSITSRGFMTSLKSSHESERNI